MSSNVRASAFAYLELDLPIIPLCPSDHKGMSHTHREACRAPGKSPLLKDWTQRGTPSTQEVTQWFDDMPSINLGLILGDTGQWNLVGIDIDGKHGEELLKEWSSGVLPATWEFITGNGRRLLYLLPDGAASRKFARKDAQAEGELALIATGQQTVLPPSIHHTGKIYEWAKGRSPSEIEIADAPQWLLNRVLIFDDAPIGAAPEMTVEEGDWTKIVEVGERNNHLLKLAGSLAARRNIPKEQILEFLKNWNQNHCQPPLPDNEVEIMVENLVESEKIKAAKYVARKGKPRDVLQPYPFAEHFVGAQRKKGVLWEYCVAKGLFYRCDQHSGPWQAVDQIYLQKEVRQELIAQDPGWDAFHKINEVVAALRELLANEENDERFDIGKHPDLEHVYVKNGRLYWRTGELKPWEPSTYSTIQLPVEWSPDAKEGAGYEKWQEVLKQWVPDEETRMFLQEYLGYCLLPECGFRTGVFLYGASSNGKSLFLEVVSKLFEGYISFTPLHWISERFETAILMDKLINVCGDIDAAYMTETATLKALIAGDPIRGEFKHGKSFHFYPVARLIFSANTLPKSSDKTGGWYSRWKFIEFPNKFKANPLFKRTLLTTMSTAASRSGLLLWAIEGLRRLYEQGEFTQSAVMTTSEMQYRAENDTVQAFIDYAIVQVTHSGHSTTMAVPSIYGIYKVWADAAGVKPVSQLEFARRCGALDIERGVRNLSGVSANCLLGVRFSTTALDVGMDEEYGFQEAVRMSTRKVRQKR